MGKGAGVALGGASGRPGAGLRTSSGWSTESSDPWGVMLNGSCLGVRISESCLGVMLRASGEKKYSGLAF